MSTKNRYILGATAFLYVLYHILTLKYSPIPWFDEVTYADITATFAKSGKFFEESRSVSWITGKLDLAYGPVYFIIQAFVTKLFGMTIFSFRMTNMFFGFANLYLIYHVCKSLNFSGRSTLFTILLIAFDPQFNQFLHSGRMDFVALFFYLSGYLAYSGIKNDAARNYLLRSILTGLLLGCAFLTNPRIMFGFAFFVFFFVYELVQHRFKNIIPIILKNVVVVLSFLSLFSVWVFGQFSSFSNYVSEIYTNSPILQAHVGITGHGFKLSYNLVMHLLSLACIVLLVINRKLNEHLKTVLFAGASVVLFLLLVSGGLHGRYFGLIVPFTVLVIVGTTMNVYQSNLSKVFSTGILSLFVLVFLFKAAYITVSLDQRDHDAYDAIISSHIPDGASVAGDFEYYYMSRKHNWKYQCLDENGTSTEQEAYFARETYDYFILNRNTQFQDFYETKILADKYEQIATIENTGSKGVMQQIVAKLPLNIYSGYSGRIFKRKTQSSD